MRGVFLSVAALAAGALLVADGVDALVKGHDLSSASLMETAQGATWFTTDGNEAPLEDILGAGGMQSVRLRLWTAGDYDLEYTLALAQRFQAAGYGIYLDMHFSDTWADGNKQGIPAAWDNSSVAALAADLRTYVKDTLAAFTAGNVTLDVLSLGNEITHGMLFPLGAISNNNYDDFATLWAASRAGVEDAVSAGTPRPQVMIHLDNGWMKDTVLSFFDGLFGTDAVAESDVDVIGLSYYPFYGVGATISALNSSLLAQVEAYGKPIYIAETDYPSKCPSTVDLSASYEVSAQGQIEWTKAIITVLDGLPDDLGAGIYYWEPAYIQVAWLGSPCESAVLFEADWTNWPDTKAYALESVNLFL